MRQFLLRRLVPAACLPAVALVALSACPARAAAPESAGADFFESKVRPVLVDHCYKCHSASAEKVKGGLRLDSRDALLKGGDTGPAVVPGKPDDSLLVKAVRHTPGDDLQMPPKKPLSAAAVADLTAWVKAGAPWPKSDVVPAAAPAANKPDVEKIRKEHWAFQPLRQPPVPEVKDRAWVKTPVDAFVLQKIEATGLKPNPPADKRTLLRRVYLDLIGLPPTPDEQRKFEADSSPDAFAKVVDDLLARPQYGERWGRHWLDVARYAETQGYERDEPKPFAWRYRDYVIKSFNDDKPFDRFLTEQLAGDEVANPTAETQAAASFLAVGTFDTIAADAKQARYDQMDDVVGTTASAFLAQTVRCARCHDHKFEPYPQADYYRLLSVFEPLQGKAAPAPIGGAAEAAAFKAATAQYDAELVPLDAEFERLCVDVFAAVEAGKGPADKDNEKKGKRPAKLPPPEILAALRKKPTERSKAEAELLTRERKRVEDYARRGADDRQTTDLDRLTKRIGEILAKRPPPPQAFVFTEKGTNGPVARLFVRGDPNKPGPEVPPAIPALLADGDVAPPKPTAATSGRRLWLANWMTGPGRHLVARVWANRIWQYHFGRGLVATSNDFGLHGDRPTHPELLDYLANELVAGGWRAKRLHRMIVLSSVYQTSAGHGREAAADPDNDLLWHWRTRRLEAEAIRDSVLAVSGKLNLETGGPPIYPPLAQTVVGDSAAADWGQSDERQAARRSVYVFQKRSIPLPELDVLGMPDSSASAEQRTVATTSLQSLLLLNSKFTFEQATALAECVRREAGEDVAAQVGKAFELVLCRPPRGDEVQAALAYLSTPAGGAEPKKESGKGEAKPPAALVSLCLVLLNANEFVYLN